MSDRHNTPDTAPTLIDTPAVDIPVALTLIERYRLVCADAIRAFGTPPLGVQREVLHRMQKLNDETKGFK